MQVYNWRHIMILGIIRQSVLYINVIDCWCNISENLPEHNVSYFTAYIFTIPLSSKILFITSFNIESQSGNGICDARVVGVAYLVVEVNHYIHFVLAYLLLLVSLLLNFLSVFSAAVSMLLNLVSQVSFVILKVCLLCSIIIMFEVKLFPDKRFFAAKAPEFKMSDEVFIYYLFNTGSTSSELLSVIFPFPFNNFYYRKFLLFSVICYSVCDYITSLFPDVLFCRWNLYLILERYILIILNAVLFLLKAEV